MHRRRLRSLILEERQTITKMHRYLKLTLIGFACCCPLSLQLWRDGMRDLNTMAFEVCFSLSGAFLPSCSAYLSDLFVGQDKADRFLTELKLNLIGASLGLFLLVWTAFLETPFTHSAGVFMTGIGPKEVQEQAWQLYPKAELLFESIKIVDNWIQYTSFFAALTLINFWIYTTLNSRCSSRGVLLCLRLFVPSLITIRIVCFFINACRDLIPFMG